MARTSIARVLATSLKILLVNGSFILTPSLMGAPVDWNLWLFNQTGLIYSGNQTINVTYSSADYHDVILGTPSWSLASTWADGTILSHGLTPINNVMQLFGSTSTVNTLSFSQPVVDPVLGPTHVYPPQVGNISANLANYL